MLEGSIPIRFIREIKLAELESPRDIQKLHEINIEIEVISRKMSLWKIKISKGIFDCFLTVTESQNKNKIAPEILNSLSDLQSSLQHNFHHSPSTNMNV